MTLGEVLMRLRREPQVGDHEIVLDEHGVAHSLYISWVDPADHRRLGFMCPCLAFPASVDANTLVVAPVVTCLECLTR